MPSKFNNLMGIFISEEISGAAASPHLPSPPPPALPKIPPEIDGIQVNFCKNPTCANYGVPPGLKKGAHRSKAASSTTGTEYRLSSKSRSGASSVVGLVCLLCKESLPLKSNLGVAEEVARLSGYLWQKRGASCPHPACLNHGVEISAGKLYYSAYGRSEIGSQRYKCVECKKTFSVGTSTRRQRLAHKNKDVFKALMNKVPFNRICELTGISMSTLYDKIDFVHRQCLAFAAGREAKLLTGTDLPALYIAVDRQTYGVNWSQRKDRRNVLLQAVGSADLDTGYVFGMNLNFEPACDPQTIEVQALAAGDYAAPHAFRQFARL